MTVRVADLIAARLRDAGTAAIFGVPGGGGNLDLVEAARRAGLPFVLTATESAGAIAALAQAEVLDRPAACLATLGPGASSVVNGVACAHLERAPLLVFTDSLAASAATFEHQRLDHRALLAPVTKWSATLSAAHARTVIGDAIARAMSHPRGPVHVDVPGDVASQAIPDDDPLGAAGGAAETLATADPGAPRRPDAAASFERLCTAARRPILVVGMDATTAADAEAIRRLCAHRAVPALVTYKAKGVVADDDPCFAGVFTNASIERDIVAAADLVIGLGLDPVELLPRPWPYAAPVVGCSRSPFAAGHVPFAAQRVGHIAAAIDELDTILTRSAWNLAVLRETVTRQRLSLGARIGGLSAQRVVELAARAAGPRCCVTVDAGAHMFPATMLWPVAAPRRMLISNGLSTMGFALPAAVGAAMLQCADPVVALTGDGGLLMCVGELATAVREHLRVVVICFNDAALSLIDVKQRARGFASAGVALGDISWARVAEGFGAAGHRAETEAELERALVRALAHDGPSVIDACIDPASYGGMLRTIRG